MRMHTAMHTSMRDILLVDVWFTEIDVTWHLASGFLSGQRHKLCPSRLAL